MPRCLLLAVTIAYIQGEVRGAEPFPTPPEQTDEQIRIMDLFIGFLKLEIEEIGARRSENWMSKRSLNKGHELQPKLRKRDRIN